MLGKISFYKVTKSLEKLIHIEISDENILLYLGHCDPVVFGKLSVSIYIKF